MIIFLFLFCLVKCARNVCKHTSCRLGLSSHVEGVNPPPDVPLSSSACWNPEQAGFTADSSVCGAESCTRRSLCFCVCLPVCENGLMPFTDCQLFDVIAQLTYWPLSRYCSQHNGRLMFVCVHIYTHADTCVYKSSHFDYIAQSCRLSKVNCYVLEREINFILKKMWSCCSDFYTET